MDGGGVLQLEGGTAENSGSIQFRKDEEGPYGSFQGNGNTISGGGIFIRDWNEETEHVYTPEECLKEYNVIPDQGQTSGG